jgi:Carboxypeptidase regulatory-like domain
MTRGAVTKTTIAVLVSFVAIILQTSPAYAPIGSLYGRVTVKGTNIGIGRARLDVQSRRLPVTTYSYGDGSYLVNLEPGFGYGLRVSKRGCNPRQINNITVRANEYKELNVSLYCSRIPKRKGLFRRRKQ